MSVPSTSDTIPLSFFNQRSLEDHGLGKALTLLYNRYKDRLTTLPKEKGWLTENLYLYQGFWLESVRVTSAVTVMASQESFQAQPTDIYLATLQKAGTTWIKALAFAIVNRSTYKSNSLSNHPLQVLNPHRCAPFVETEALYPIPAYVSGHSPRLFSTHMPYTSLPQSILDSGCCIVYTCRNPKDLLVSLFHYANRLRDRSLGPMSFEEAFEMFTKGLMPFGPYWDHVKRLADFLGYPFTEEEVHEIVKLCGFETLKEVNKHGMVAAGFPKDVFFRNGKVGDWNNHLTDEMSQILDQLTKEKFDGLDISF